VVERAANRELLAACTCVWLQVPAAELARRMAADPTPRPGLFGGDPAAEIAELERRRAPLYAALEPLAVDGRDPAADVAARIERLLAT
jgi:shikimate kinase